MAKDKPKVGRPTVMTDDVLDKLRQAFLFGATKEEACAFADIGYRTLYDYIAKNPEFSQEIEKWQRFPILLAKRKVVNEITEDVKNAQWYLERKTKAEFSLRQEHTGADGKDLPTPILGGISKVDNENKRTDSEIQ